MLRRFGTELRNGGCTRVSNEGSHMLAPTNCWSEKRFLVSVKSCDRMSESGWSFAPRLTDSRVGGKYLSRRVRCGPLAPRSIKYRATKNETIEYLIYVCAIR